MTYVYQIYPEHRLAITLYHGAVNGEDVAHAMDAVFLDERWQPGYAAVWDIRTIEALIIVPEGVKAIAEKTKDLREQIGGGKAAILVRRSMDHTIAALLTRRRLTGPEREVQTFRQAEEAEAWLGMGHQLDSLVEDLRRQRAANEAT